MKCAFSCGWRVAAAALALSSTGVWAQELPDGPGREETAKLCRQCHELARSISRPQDRAGWEMTMSKMVAFGMMRTPDATLHLGPMTAFAWISTFNATSAVSSIEAEG